MFWVAFNEEALKYNNYSNYTTDPYDDDGVDPIVSSTFTRGETIEWSQLDSDNHNEGLETQYGIYLPDEPGYHANVWCCNLQRPGIGHTIDFSLIESTFGADLYSDGLYKVLILLDTLRIHRYYAGGMDVADNKTLDQAMGDRKYIERSQRLP
jgi:hypothetical protein